MPHSSETLAEQADLLENIKKRIDFLSQACCAWNSEVLTVSDEGMHTLGAMLYEDSQNLEAVIAALGQSNKS